VPVEDVELSRKLPAVTTQADDSWAVHDVREAIDKLPPIEREVVKIAYLHGLTHGEAAAQLGVPVGTVKSRSHRAHRRLAGHLGHLRDGRS
jgi:RNA polymerase sigma-70 factor (ECF subfamily)